MVLHELGDWLHCVMSRHLEQDWQGIHDEGTFLTSWAGYYAYTLDPSVPELASDLFDKWDHWAQDHFYHGYHPAQEVHHGTEHFLIFLDWFYRIVPGNERARAALVDGTHHVGNWAYGTPSWYDWQKRRYVSYSLGTKVAGTEGFNFVDHLRLLHMAMSGYNATGNEDYLSLCLSYGRVWAEAIRDLPEIPLFLDADDQGKVRFGKLLKSFLKAAPQNLTPFACVENHIASGCPKLLREIGAATGEEVFRQAALRLGRECTRYLASPIANPAGQVVCSLLDDGMELTDLNLSTETFCEWLQNESLEGQELSIQVERIPAMPDSLGYRFDMPTYYMGQSGFQQPLQVPAPANLMLAWSITGEMEFALNACSMALGKLQLSRQIYQDGRHHGCTSQSIAAAVRGHGRCWGAGDISTILAHTGAQHAYAETYPNKTEFPGLYTN